MLSESSKVRHIASVKRSPRVGVDWVFHSEQVTRGAMSSVKPIATKVTPQYLTRKESFRLWFECLTRAANNPQFIVDEAYYSAWGAWRTLSFNEWWGTVGKALLVKRTDYVVLATAQAVSGNSVLVSVPKSLTPTQAANELRALLIAHYEAISHIPSTQQSYALTAGAEMKQTVVRSYLHTYDAYHRLLQRSEVLPRAKVINRTGKRDADGRTIAGSGLGISGKELLHEVRLFYLARTEKWKHTKRQVDGLPSALMNGMTMNPATNERVDYGGDESSALRAIKRYLESANGLIANAASGNFPGDY